MTEPGLEAQHAEYRRLLTIETLKVIASSGGKGPVEQYKAVEAFADQLGLSVVGITEDIAGRDIWAMKVRTPDNMAKAMDDLMEAIDEFME